ncbi:MAG: inositol monophosphatase [Planctomycetes bacterium]|nr:inositol monophosphatase [Planctomycetota bacterium]
MRSRLDFARDLAQRTGVVLSRRFEERRDELARANLESGNAAPHTEFKGRRELVTEVDREIEQLLVDAIRTGFPGDAILAEEGVASPRGQKDREARFVWVLDPIDGTTNFVHGHPSFSISIGLLEGEDVACGVVLAPALGGRDGGECYWGGPAVGAYCNDRRIAVSRTEHLRDAVVATGFSYGRNEPGADTNIQRFAAALMEARGIRRCGSAALDLAFVAAGIYDAYWEKGLAPYDVAAGIALVLGAGGAIDVLERGARPLWDGQVLASNGCVGAELAALFDR